jgi:SNF2 family DNA or RNA helicase
VRGVLPDALVTVVDARWFGSAAVELTYKAADGSVANQLVYRDDEARLDLAEVGRPWSFDGDAELFRLVAEAKRIDLAYLFDPYLAVTTALVEPLPHQITAVYESMLPVQPLRFLLADDPGAGKTIMTGLFIRELLIRGDLRRCLIVAPGSLVEQWQSELEEKFRLHFELLTSDRIAAPRTGNPFNDEDLLIARLDKLSRDEDLQQRLAQSQDWDLIVFDEAHKLSASLQGDEVRKTKRRLLGERARELTRHFLLLTATPHSGKEDEFQLFLSLLDPDRFEGHRRSSARSWPPRADAGDMMRRLVKEGLVKFDGTPLFPPRHAYVVPFRLSPAEASLYEQVTTYVREEMNRAERLKKAGDAKRGIIVGFALTVLQRRLASSPEAIYQSLKHRRQRLERKLAEAEVLRQGAQARLDNPELALLTIEQIDELEADDADELPAAEAEVIEEEAIDLATAASTIAELRTEILSLQQLERVAAGVRASGTDTKWTELAALMQETPEMRDASGSRRKLIVFSEHRDTLNYLAERLRTLIGREEAVVEIHGGMPRGVRRAAEAAFKNDPEVLVLVATDAAGEGINLQRAHLMVNYDLPWNPNRIEQRFGRIHRIGQNEVCHLWNLVADETREGDVYRRLLEKLAAESEALGGQVFDVLGRLTFGEGTLRDLLIRAIRSSDTPEVRAELARVIDGAVDPVHLRALLAERAVGADVLDTTKVAEVREEMERANARRLQPHFIRTFFLEGFRRLGGRIVQQEPGRYEVGHVPAFVRQRARDAGMHRGVLPAYERVAFDKSLITVQGVPLAEFVCPGHPLLDATIDVLLEQHRDLLRRGAVLVDPADRSEQPRVLLFLEHAITDARTTTNASARTVSRRLVFVEAAADGTVRSAGPAPYHDYRPLEPELEPFVAPVLDQPWLRRSELEEWAISYAVEHVSREHLDEVRSRTEAHVERVRAAVKQRLTHEVNYWDHRAEQLALREQAGRTPTLNSARARSRANDLQERLRRRERELDLERALASLPPVVVGGAIVLPAGLLERLQGIVPGPDETAKETARVEAVAMAAVMASESAQGFEPVDVSAEKVGYDIRSRDPQTGHLRFVEVKGRAVGATTVTVTKNEILTCLNAPDHFWLAVVEVGLDGPAGDPAYRLAPFSKEPDFAATSVNYSIRDLLAATTHG